MYLGELVFRAMMVFSSPDWFTAILLSVALNVHSIVGESFEKKND